VLGLAGFITIPHLSASAALEHGFTITGATQSRIPFTGTRFPPSFVKLFEIHVYVGMFGGYFLQVVYVVEHTHSLLRDGAPILSFEFGPDGICLHFEHERFRSHVSSIGHLQLSKPLTETVQGGELIDDDLVQMLFQFEKLVFPIDGYLVEFGRFRMHQEVKKHFPCLSFVFACEIMENANLLRYLVIGQDF
jgi:hypothetical protein